MSDRVIYFLFTDTGSYLSRVINMYTKKSLNHVSIGLDPHLKELYSFGRKQPKNPFIGGFIKEDVTCDFLKHSSCEIYSFVVTEEEYEAIIHNIKEIEAKKQLYKYNFIGLFGVMFEVKINRKYALFCSEFVATVLRDTNKFQFGKPICFITPGDIRSHPGMQLLYKGILGDYEKQKLKEKAIPDQAMPKQSFLFLLSSRFKGLGLK